MQLKRQDGVLAVNRMIALRYHTIMSDFILPPGNGCFNQHSEIIYNGDMGLILSKGEVNAYFPKVTAGI